MIQKEPLSPRLDNRLLQALPADVLDRLAPDLEAVTLDFKDELYGAGKPIAHVHFPVSCVGSLLTVMENGDAVEVG